MFPEDNKHNLILAVILSIIVIFGFEFFYNTPRQAELAAQEEIISQQAEQIVAAEIEQGIVSPRSGQEALEGADQIQAISAVNSARIRIETPSLTGSLRLTGARLDDITLHNFRVALAKDSPEVTFLNPEGTPDAIPFYADAGWYSADTSIPVPDAKTVWIQKGEGALSAETPITLYWDNGAGLIFERKIAVDASYMFTITQSVKNLSGQDVRLNPWGRLVRRGTPQILDFYLIHEGAYGVFDGVLNEADYEDLRETPQPQTFVSAGGWSGFTDKYWMANLIPNQERSSTFRFLGRPTGQFYQTDFLDEELFVPAGGTAERSHNLYVGAKLFQGILDYEDNLGINKFNLTIDFGWFILLTKPMYYALTWLYSHVGNFGIAIILFTIFVRLLLFPLAHKSYKTMTRMKKLTPKIQELKEKHGDDKQGMQQALMALYRSEQVNPLSGCLPILVQIPIFFALYKVLFISLEMRHAPFFGWIQDLSAPDPTSLFNLFGLLPFDPPSFLMIGILPLLMGLTMYLQQKMNPPPPDPLQAKIFAFLPLIFTVMLASFPAGLVLYWTVNNILSITQQYMIMRSMGVSIGDRDSKTPA